MKKKTKYDSTDVMKKKKYNNEIGLKFKSEKLSTNFFHLRLVSHPLEPVQYLVAFQRNVVCKRT